MSLDKKTGGSSFQSEEPKNLPRTSFRFKTHSFSHGFILFFARLKTLFREPVFLTLTIVGNSTIVCGAVALYHYEHDVNPAIQSMLDTIWWAVATVTTVGYGDVSPITPAGKIVGIVMMIVGTALFWTYTAIFASALVTSEITDLDDELRRVEKSLRRLNSNAQIPGAELKEMVQRLQSSLDELRRLEDHHSKRES